MEKYGVEVTKYLPTWSSLKSVSGHGSLRKAKMHDDEIVLQRDDNEEKTVVAVEDSSMVGVKTFWLTPLFRGFVDMKGDSREQNVRVVCSRSTVR